MSTSRFILAASIVTALVNSSYAAPVNKGSTGFELTDSASWGGTVLDTTSTATWISTSTTGAHTVSAPVLWNGMNFASGLAADVSITGSPISLSLVSATSGDVVLNGSGKNISIANDLTLTATYGSAVVVTGQTGTNRLQLNSSSGNLIFGSITASGSATANDINLYLRGGSTGNVINGTVTVDGQLGKADGGTWTLNGNNSIGWVYLVGGTLLAGHDSAFGSNTIVLGQGNSPIIASKDSTARNFPTGIDFNPATAGQAFTNTIFFGQTVGGTGALSFAGTVSLGTTARNIATNVNTTFSGNVTGVAGAITKTGTGTLTLSGANNTYTGGTTINDGFVVFTNSGAVPATGLITIGAAGSLVASGAQTTVMGWLNSGRVNTTSAGVIALVGNSFESINFSTGGFNALGLSSSVSNATYTGTITPGSSGYIFGGTTGTTLTLNTVLGGAGNFTKNGAATLDFAGTSQNVGTVTVNAGTVQNGTITGTSFTATGGTISAALAGGGVLTTSNTVTLSGNNTFSGGTTANGTLLLGHDNALGTGLVTQGASAITIASADATARAFANNIKVANGITFGQTTGGTGTLTFSGGVDLNGAVRSFTTNVNTTLSGVVSSANGAITKAGAATLTLSNANTFTGITTISAGTLALGHDAALGTSQIRTGAGGTIASSDATARTILTTKQFDFATDFTFGSAGTGDLKFNDTLSIGSGAKTATINNAITEFAGVISGGASTNAFTKAGTGTLILSAANTYVRPTVIANGTLSIGSLNSVVGGTASSNLGAPITVANGTIAMGATTTTGVLKYTGTGETTDRVINLAGTTGGATLDQSGTGLLKFSSPLAATGVGSKTLTLQGSTAGIGEVSGVIVDNDGTNKTSVAKSGTGAWLLSGANTYTGGTTINAGTLTAGHVNALGSGAVTVSGGTLELGTYNIAPATIALNGGTLTNTAAYTGTVNVGGDAAITGMYGTLASGISPTRAINTAGGLSVSTLTGQGVFSGGLVTVTGAHTPGNSPGAQTFSNGLSYANGTTLNFEINADGTLWDTVTVQNGLTIGSTVSLNLSLFGTAAYDSAFWNSDHAFPLLGFNAKTGDISAFSLTGLGDYAAEGTWNIISNANDYTAQWTAVPEPGSAIMLLGGLAVLTGTRRRHRKA